MDATPFLTKFQFRKNGIVNVTHKAVNCPMAFGI